MDDLLTTLKTACQGMTYPSERDEPLKPFVRRVEELTADDFFLPLLDGDDGEEWRNLLNVLNANLTDLRVRRVHRRNESQVDVEIMGITKDGQQEAGVRMLSIET